jgi:predicted nucleotidyltransferase
MVLAPRAERPIDPITLAVLREIQNASVALGLEAFLVGATARIILLEHVFGLQAERATRDIDFAFAVENWDQFKAIKRYLVTGSGFQEMERVMQRLLYQPKGCRRKFVVDLIPFGGLEVEKNTIAWPPDMSILMNVAGYRDALVSAVPVEVEPRLIVSIASVAGIAILKLFAWVNRGREDPKDAIDLLTLLRRYHEAGNQDRIYEDASTVLESVDYDIELSGAWLLGRDVATISSPEIRNELGQLLNDTKLTDRLITDMSRAIRVHDDALEYAKVLLEQFSKGFTASE